MDFCYYFFILNGLRILLAPFAHLWGGIPCPNNQIFGPDILKFAEINKLNK